MFANLKVGLRLAIGYGFIVVLMLVVGFIATTRINDLDRKINLVVNDRMPKVTWVNDWMDAVNEVARVMRNMVLLNAPDAVSKEDNRIASMRLKMDASIDSLRRTITLPDGVRLLDQALNLRDPIRVSQDRIREFAHQGNDSAALTLLFGEYRDLQSRYFKALADLNVYQSKTAAQDGQEASAMASGATFVILMVLCLSILLAIGIAWWVTQSITRPIARCMSVAESVAQGETNLRIEVDRTDETGKLLLSMRSMVEAIQRMAADATMLAQSAVQGKLNMRADASKHSGDFRKIIQGVNDTLDAVIQPLNMTAKYVDDISKGVIPPAITDTYNGDFNVIKNNLNNMVSMMNNLLKETELLIQSAADGELQKRANADLFQGSWKQLLAGFNNTVNNIVSPLMLTAEYVDKVSKGVIPPEITDVYKGQYNVIKINLNSVVAMMNNLLRETDTLVKAAVGGRLDTRAKADAFVGGWHQLVAGINQTLDAVLQPIQEAAAVLEKVANRDMSARVMGNYQGDHAKIKNALNQAVENLDKALAQVSEGASQVASASEQISSGSQALAQGANEQASALEEISSSLEEIASMTKQNADNATMAKNLSVEADSNAKQGVEAMDRMSGAIGKIKESSDQTAKIVKTIDEIAMQTNLLALNAAVEAARAGDAGRGFAVVAEEVRNLAQRSAQAAKNTADMIGESVRNADDGVKIAQDVSRSFELIAGSSTKVNGLIAEIAAASKEQSQGIEQVSVAVSQMDKVTQQNAANSEESASSSEELSSQAQELQAMVSQFTLTLVSVNPSVAAPRRLANTPRPIGKQRVSSQDVIPMDDSGLREF